MLLDSTSADIKPRPVFRANVLLEGKNERYVTMTVNAAKIIASWRPSLFSFEWMRPDGRIKKPEELTPPERAKREAVEERLRNGASIDQPVLGIGVMDNIEIGIGRAEFLTLAALGVASIPVHIPKAYESDFQSFRADVK